MQTLELSRATAQMILDEELDIYDVLMDRETRLMPGEDLLIQEMYDEVARDNGLHPDDDCDEIIEIMVEQIADEHG
jgi:hypothetical protein